MTHDHTDKIFRWSTGAVMLAAMTLCLPVSAKAGQVIAAGNGQSQSLSCDGGEAVLRGNDNQITFVGPCRSVLVEGNGNQVRSDVRDNGPVIVRGNDNAVRYRVAGDGDARVQVAGMNNNVTPDTAAGSARPVAPVAAAGEEGDVLAIREENARRTIDCAGKSILIEGNGDEYTLEGGCQSLRVRGEGLRIHAQMAPGSQISVQGNGDLVSWSLSGAGAEPSTSVDGEGSRITRTSHADRQPPPVYAPAPRREPPVVAAEPPPVVLPMAPAAPSYARPLAEIVPPSTSKLVIDGNHEARDTDCADRDVLVKGNFELLVLRGGCRSIEIQGDSNKIQAELLSGAHIHVHGAVNAIAYAITKGSANAIATMTGDNNHIRRVSSLGAVSAH